MDAHPEPEARPQNGEGRQESESWLISSFDRRWLRRAATAMLALLVLSAAVHTLLTVYFGLRLRATLAELRARGEPLEIRQACAASPVPPQENAAPLYAAAYALIKAPKAYEHPPGTEKWDVAAAHKALEQDSDALRLVLAAARRHRCQFDIKWEDGYTAKLEPLYQMRDLARLVAAAAVVAAEDKQTEEAWGRVTTGFRMGKHVGMEPPLISQVISYAVDGITVGAMKMVLAKSPASRQVHEALSTALSGHDLNAAHIRAFQTDRALGLDLFHRLVRQPGWLDTTAWERGSLKRMLVSSYLGRPFQYTDELVYLGIMDSFTRSAARPFRPEDSQQDEQTFASRVRYCPLSWMVLPSLARVKMERDKTVANRSLLQTAVALEVYRTEKGAYPETLALLRQEFPNVTSEDVFSGKELLYRLEREGFLLYSLGPDCRDDGGRPLDQREYPPRGDLVWIPHGKEDAFKARAAQAGPKKSAR